MTADDDFFSSEQLIIHRVDWEYGGFLLQRGRTSDEDPTLPQVVPGARCTAEGSKALCSVGSAFTDVTLILSTGDTPSGPLSAALDGVVTGTTKEHHRITLSGRGTDLSVSLILNDGPLGVLFVRGDMWDQPIDIDIDIWHDPDEEEAPQVWRITPVLPRA